MRIGVLLLVVVAVGLGGDAAWARSREEPISLRRGLPKPDGLGRLVIVTNFESRDGRAKAVKRLAEHRDAKVLRFKASKIEDVRKRLQREGAEFVALAVTPETVDVNFHYEVLELARDLDDDPMPDFHFGYLTARDGEDLERLIDGILRREAEPPAQPRAEVVPLTGSGDQVQPLDFLLHFGHGQAWRVDGGLTGTQVGALELPRAPVVISGACFNGVLSRSYHKSAMQRIFLAPTTIDPADLMTLNWVHAGASAYLAALEGDRGEMAMAEWEYLRQHACPLGEVIGYQYRLAFTSVYADFTKFPRYVPGHGKRMGFYDVMLRGMVSRLLLSDPSFRPLHEPLDEPAHVATVAYDAQAKRVVVDVAVDRYSQGLHLNYLPASKRGVFDRRVYVRVPLPDDVPTKFEETVVEARTGPEIVEITRHHVRHEVWGGTRYLNLQVEVPQKSIGRGTTIRYTLPVR
jgi:hypothetical protein